MKHYYPRYFKNFKCVADKCPDSCCKDWDVVVDDESYELYKNVKGEFGAKLNSLMTIDGDGDRIFIPQSGRCPFWNGDMLCDIYINLGEERLCKTCREFPRLSMEFPDFTEHMLSLACPEAARLILQSEAEDNFRAHSEDEFLNFLLTARTKTLEIFSDKSLAFPEKLSKVLLFNRDVQTLLDCEKIDTNALEKIKTENSDFTKKDCEFVFDLHKRLEIMGGEWKNLLDEVSRDLSSPDVSKNFGDEFCALARYYVLRYYLSAYDSGDVLSPIKRLACCYIVISKAENHIYKTDGKLSFEKRKKLIQLYSKEVEHSYENSEYMNEEFFTNADFSAESICAALK